MDSGGSSNIMLRDYRKGNWTVQETMVLIEAKKMDDERRMKRQDSERGNKPGELRWKWVEDYCWRNGCLRSQNQCNDKWDNLMRDFKKVREYERRVAEKLAEGDGSNNMQSYWKIERNERKEKNLPTNMLPEIYEALVEVVDKRGQKVLIGGSGTSYNPSTTSLSPTLQQQPPIQLQIAALPLPPPPQLLSPPAIAQQQPPQPPNLPYTQPLPTMCDSSERDRSEHSDSPAKRRRKGDQGEAGTSSGNNNLQEVGSAIFKSAAIIAETIQASEEREERRHREMLSLHERRLQIEESKAEINRQGINSLVDSVNRLANSILSLAANNNHQPPPPT
ncbi:trihelix transcription factor ASR3-like [Lycium barbarum]|uniref:trihelix transcription factor ASR3-like n=1 Tax=Lycium barbarum TaxID=112863 RepID=UPI00293E5514|nr:trihelix transcription factor ASR3-like [Lycium barbarum]